MDRAFSQSKICSPLHGIDFNNSIKVDEFMKSISFVDSGPGISRENLIKMGTEQSIGLDKCISLLDSNEDLDLINVFGSPFTSSWSCFLVATKVVVYSYPLRSDEQVKACLKKFYCFNLKL